MLQSNGGISRGGTSFAEGPSNPTSAGKVSYDKPLAVPKGDRMSFDRQDTSSQCAVAPFIAGFKGITSQAEGAAMVARGVALARRRFRAHDYRLAHCRALRPLEDRRCRREIAETDRRSRQPG
jgi:hypothetical protein